MLGAKPLYKSICPYWLKWLSQLLLKIDGSIRKPIDIQYIIYLVRTYNKKYFFLLNVTWFSIYPLVLIFYDYWISALKLIFVLIDVVILVYLNNCIIYMMLFKALGAKKIFYLDNFRKISGLKLTHLTFLGFKNNFYFAFF